jgi:4-amino-4-deoxy-L-arabinose transferase-like glycosyltransferase
VSNIVGYSESGIIANNLVNGNGYTFDFYGERRDSPLQAFMPPAYTSLIALSLWLSANPAETLGLIQAVLSTLVVVSVFYLVWELSSEVGIALLAALGTAIYPIFVINSALPIQTVLNLFLLSVLMVVTVMLPKHFTMKWAGLTGFVFGINLLSRPALMGYLPLLLVWLWLNAKRDLLKLFKAIVVMVIFMTVTVLPWMLRNYQVLGQFGVISTQGGFNFWSGNNPFATGSPFNAYSERLDQYLGVPHDAARPEILRLFPYPMPKGISEQVSSIAEVELDQMLYRAGLDFIRDDPARWLELLMAKLKGFWWFRTSIGEVYEASWTQYYKILYAILLIFFTIPGLLLSLQHWRRYLLLWFLLFYCTFIYTLFCVLTRFRWEIEPYLLIFAALTVSHLFKKMRILRFALGRTTIDETRR